MSHQASDEYQRLRWMRLALVKRSKAGESAPFDGTISSAFPVPDLLTAMRTAFKSIIDNMTFAKSTVTELVWFQNAVRIYGLMTLQHSSGTDDHHSASVGPYLNSSVSRSNTPSTSADSSSAPHSTAFERHSSRATPKGYHLSTTCSCLSSFTVPRMTITPGR
jgi:hypothetical protein